MHSSSRGEAAVVSVETCEFCGGEYRGWLEEGSRCWCERSRVNAEAQIASIDPGERMKFENLDSSGLKLSKVMKQARLVLDGESRRGVMLCGDPGIGKTHFLVGLLREATRNNITAVYHNVPQLFRRMQDTYSHGSRQTVEQIIAAVCRHEIVLLDDFGKERTTEDAESLMYLLVDALYASHRTLFVSTNLLGELQGGKRYDSAVVDRLRDMCRMIALDDAGRSRRDGRDW